MELQEEVTHARRERNGRRLLQAVQQAYVNEVFELCAMGPNHIDMLAVDDDGFTALHHAARIGHLDIAMELIRVAPEATMLKTFWGKKPSGWTPLMILANRSHKGMENDMARLACAMIKVMRVEDVAHRNYGTNMMAKCISIWDF